MHYTLFFIHKRTEKIHKLCAKRKYSVCMSTELNGALRFVFLRFISFSCCFDSVWTVLGMKNEQDREIERDMFEFACVASWVTRKTQTDVCTIRQWNVRIENEISEKTHKLIYFWKVSNEWMKKRNMEDILHYDSWVFFQLKLGYLFVYIILSNITVEIILKKKLDIGEMAKTVWQPKWNNVVHNNKNF